MAEYTQKYCVPGGVGFRSGNSWANAYDLPEALAAIESSTTINIGGGTYTATNDTDFDLGIPASSPSITTSAMIIGWNAAHTSIATSWDDCPILDCNGYQGLGGGHINYMCYWGLKIINSDQHGFSIEIGRAHV